MAKQNLKIKWNDDSRLLEGWREREQSETRRLARKLALLLRRRKKHRQLRDEMRNN